MFFCKKRSKNMFPLSVSNNNYRPYKQSLTPSFGNLRKVSYVVLDGHSVVDKKIIEDVTKHLTKQIKFGRPEDNKLRLALKKATGDSSLAQAYQSICRIGKHLITGQDAINLEKIWTSNNPLNIKKIQAADVVRKLFNASTHEKIAIVADSVNIPKSKIKYMIKNVYSTIF